MISDEWRELANKLTHVVNRATCECVDCQGRRALIAAADAYDEQKERIEKLKKWLEDQVLKYRLNPDVATAYTETLARVRAHPRMLKIKGY